MGVDSVSVARADKQLNPLELVIGLSIGGKTRAYPLNMITGPKRELINDKLGGVAVAVTWCSLCASAVVFDRTFPTGTLHFGLEGSLWKNNMVMYDIQTRSLWSQIQGKCMSGSLQGRVLTRLPSHVVTWARWKSEHPQTTVAMFSPTSSDYDEKTVSALDSMMFAITTEKGARGWTYQQMRETPLINETWGQEPLLVIRVDATGNSSVFSRKLGDKLLTFTLQQESLVDEQTQSTWNPMSGVAIDGPSQGAQLQSVPTTTALQTEWIAFYPETEFDERVRP